MLSRLYSFMPGLHTLFNYQRQWFADDVRAALSVAAVALPVAIAYAQLTGVNAAVGLYSCVLPMMLYALFGTSKQLIIGPDAATCAVIAAVVTPLAAGDSFKHWQLVITMTAMTGFWCFIASRFKLGVLADFLSKPILMGLLNGVAITIIVGQFSKVFGFTFDERYLLERLGGVPTYLSQTHIPTLLMALFTLGVYFVLKRLKPTWPASMFAIALGAVFVWLFNLEQFEIKTIGTVTGGLPVFNTPVFDVGIIRELVVPALNLAIVSFVSMMLTARSFAAKNGYDIDADKEFRALGIANLASALSQGFAVSGADSRTAVNDDSGGKTQLVSIIAAAIIGVIALFLTAPLEFIPSAALGIVLIIASVHLLDLKAVWQLKFKDKQAFYLASATLFAVLFIGVIPGITLAVLLGLFQFIRTVMRPSDTILGVDIKGVVRSLDETDKAKAVQGVFIYRFNSPLTYFNASYFKRRLLEQYARQKEDTQCVIIDAVPCFTHLDLSVMAMLADLDVIFKKRGIRLELAGRKRQLLSWFKTAGIASGKDGIYIHSDLYIALQKNSVSQHVDEVTMFQSQNSEEINAGNN
ncbi:MULTISPECIES: SulP family inorganic anion transporter [unclassified Pseudoalteromonas]|uniref:SulP family inorganic anion transporter n=1 Tax=unclassified Pseudoalteromonas TaxID=194690 RepID=UPI0002DF3870|nr:MULTISPECIES: SulP family inorganic anion transporter [unclassified Pseudoalteromonas]MAY58753.1 SulP family inorganic anion transporter [Pseudoalteromonas sp.]MDN3405951.1 SulP family inorganic anion transporter [Pseudoalteromonas sp. APC 3218]MDN3408744.1 SulP family inorganic anion transporter [Pseudoalteromonas sp. APC 3894]MDN3416149.1 SulP family inorganic anion transporter [Pseudoalteromonas sp. APC 3227]MDN3419847.1 SulP family inorganic anion transporter [Pseudoalteromonas sp. APC 